MGIEMRLGTEDDFPAIVAADARAFGVDVTEQDVADRRLVLDPARCVLALDDGQVVGTTADTPFEMTLPGGECRPVPGVTWVSVAPTHRRRGILSALMREQHQRFLAQGYALAILTASEGGIYARFGYGPATVQRRLEIDRRLVGLRPDLADTAPVRMLDAAEARQVVPALHDAWRAVTPGALDRTAAGWDLLFLDRESWRGGASSNFFVVHPEGFARYRTRLDWPNGIAAGEIEVGDLFAATPRARIALWRFLLGLDLSGPIRVWSCPPGDPVEFLLTDPRQVRVLQQTDGVWVRLLDVPAALAARRYGCEGELVLDVHDRFLDRGGRFALRGGPDGASCIPTGRLPDLTCSVGALGSAYLGVHRPSTLAAAGLVEEHTAGALRRADVLFSAEAPALHGTNF